ncbi:uncharacterized protein LOC121419119 [Lytechinus variegatus]|uniref:uncharacterized protein LOC121419119 n=1 Tax=Lytechinus variegatus TaxID=7654 RepID=UPI001BB12887|nr:uncharacterized protein LOC121419119 [Lytechinus variegatus]
MAIIISCLLILFLNGYQVKALSFMQGQEVSLVFPYPCNSTDITLKQSNRVPFYRSTAGSSLYLPPHQALRFNVQNRIEIGTCSLELTISDVTRGDQGTYILFVYKDGHEQFDHKDEILLQVEYPPGKASCMVGEDKGGEWVAVNCTANVGSLPGRIGCYQNGLWMPPLTDPTETDSLLKQTILIQRSQPAFCCSSTLNEYKERCKCHDTALFLDDSSTTVDPCPTITTQTSISTTVNKSAIQNYLFTTAPTTDIKDYHKSLLIYSLLSSPVVIALFIALVILLYRQRKISQANSSKIKLEENSEGDQGSLTERLNQAQEL